MSAQPNLIDKVVAYFAPERGIERVKARMHADLVLRTYDAASRSSRTGGWNPSNTSAVGALRKSLPILQARSRDLVRNDPHGSKAVRSLANSMVGAGIVPKLTLPLDNEKMATAIVTNAFKRWANDVRCSYDERNTLYALQHLGARAIVESGEVLFRRRRTDAKYGLPVPLQIEILESDFLDTAKEGTLEGGNFIIQGVEFNAQGKRVAYYLFEQHPGDNLGFKGSVLKSNRIPADQILHCFEILRPGQVRGIPWFAPCLVTFKDYSDFLDATLLRQKIAAYFTGFVRNIQAAGDGDPFSGLLAGGDTADDVELKPGAMQKLAPGEDITFPNLPTASSFSDVSPKILHAIAAGVGLSYEALTGDFSQVNYSSARMANLEFMANLDVWRWHMLIPHFCQRSLDWFAESATAIGIRTKDLNAVWTPPRRAMIDPTKEIPATLLGIRGGIQSLSAAIRELGDDPEEVLNEIKQDNMLIDLLQLTLDSDPRKVMKAGSLQQPTEDSQAASKGDDPNGE